ncbi:Cyanovirin-N [Xylariaceae sp. FL0016]|nr:Cyanovirin-N [Xylariaceae sp. FL0016]
MHLLVTFTTLIGITAAIWRAACSHGGDAQFHTIQQRPILSTICVGSQGPVCTKLDLGRCYMNKNGHLMAVQNGGFDRSCTGCHLTGINMTVLACDCKMFGKDAPFQHTEVETEDLVQADDGMLTCWGAGKQACFDF